MSPCGLHISLQCAHMPPTVASRGNGMGEGSAPGAPAGGLGLTSLALGVAWVRGFVGLPAAFTAV